MGGVGWMCWEGRGGTRAGVGGAWSQLSRRGLESVG